MRIQATKILVSTFLLIAAANLGGCGGGGATQVDPAPGDVHRVGMEALYGCSEAGITLSQRNLLAKVDFADVTSAGKFVALTLPEGSGAAPRLWYWTFPEGGSANLVPLAVPVDGGLEAGVVAHESAAGASATLWVELAEGTVGDEPPADQLAAAAEELAVVTLSNEKVNLSWTQMLPGDFNFDGVVNTTDLIPLAGNLGATIDRETPAARQQTAYWLDHDQDGEVTCSDSQVIAGNFKRELAGFVIKQNGAQVPGEVSDELSVTVEQAVTFEGLPPRYSVELEGSAEEQWSIAAVGTDGAYGEEIEVSGEQTDLVATVNISGVELIDLPIILPDGSTGSGKSTLRVIEPIDIVDRGTIAQPVYREDNIFYFAGVPRGQRVLLDCSYLPAVNLATGASLQPAGGQGEDAVDTSELVVTSVPFMLPETKGIARIDIDINIDHNPFGGYFVELNAFTVVPGQLPEFNHTLLSYQDGRLKRDTDNDDDFADELGFTDADRDGVSDFWIQEVQDIYFRGPELSSIVVVRGTVESIDPVAGTITLSAVEPLGDGMPFGSGMLSLGINEDTLFNSQVWGGGINPLDNTELEPGAYVEVTFLQLSDPMGGRPDVFWVEKIMLLPDEAS